MSTICNSCGAHLKSEAKFCKACGAKVAVEAACLPAVAVPDTSDTTPVSCQCRACGGENVPAAKFCRHCGGSMALAGPHYTSIGVAGDYDAQGFVQPAFFETHKIRLLVGLVLAAVVAVLGWTFWPGRDADPCLSADAASQAECAAVAAITSSQLTGQSAEMFVIADANVRDKPTTKNATITDKIQRGTKIGGTVEVGIDGPKQWLKLNDGTGYVSIVNLSLNQPPELETLFNDLKWIPGVELKVRTRPDDVSMIIDTVPQYEPVILAGITKTGYLEIKQKSGGVGYVRNANFVISATNPSDIWQAMDLPPGYTRHLVGSGRATNIVLWLNSPPHAEGSSYAEYTDSKTGTLCSANLTYQGLAENGLYLFTQSPRGTSSCYLYPRLEIGLGETGSGLYNVFWRGSEGGLAGLEATLEIDE